MDYTDFRLGYHLLLTTDTKFGLPRGELSKSKDDYILKGRYIGTDRGGMQPDFFLKGHPIDILGKFIKERNYASENSVGTVTYNLYGSRILFPASDITIDSKIRGEDFFNGMWHHRNFLKEGMEFCYDSGKLKTRHFVIDPRNTKLLRNFDIHKDLEYSEKDSGYIPKSEVIEPTVIPANESSAPYKNRNILLTILHQTKGLCQEDIGEGEIHQLIKHQLEYVKKRDITPEFIIDFLFENK